MKVSQSRKCQELWKFLQVQSKKTSCSHEDRKRKGRQKVTSAAGDKFISVNWTSDCSPNKCFTEFKGTDTYQHQNHSWIAAKKALLKDTNKKKRLAWAKKHKQWTLDQWISVLLSRVQILDFCSNHHVFVRRRVCEQMISACVVPTVKRGGGGVMMWGCFAGDCVCDLFRIQGTLNQHGYHSILHRYAIPSGLSSVGI
jgi:hypothetical protein